MASKRRLAGPYKGSSTPFDDFGRHAGATLRARVGADSSSFFKKAGAASRHTEDETNRDGDGLRAQQELLELLELRYVAGLRSHVKGNVRALVRLQESNRKVPPGPTS